MNGICYPINAMYIVTAGKKFNDIDAFGCAVAYTELLHKEGKEAQAVFIGPLNHSVTRLALQQGAQYLTEYAPTAGDQLVYVDISDPDHFAFPENHETIFEVYDHHYGREDYWTERLGDRSHIERLGAAATLIWEEFEKRGFANGISAASANLLALAILQNTLNFTSTETKERDHDAFKKLQPYLTMTSGWEQRYFEECAAGMRENFDDALRNDTKIRDNYFGDNTFVFSQLEITEDPIAFLAKYQPAIDTYWSEFSNKHCLINIADISSKTSLLYSDNQVWLHATIKPLFDHVIESTDLFIRVPMHQRKQIFKLLE